ncbi:MAG: peptide deformylase [Candidatus Binatia bacterium]
MSVRAIYKFPDPLLAKRSSPVDNIDGRVAGFVDDMVETMYAANGVGLAAPQVGVLERAIVIDTDGENRGRRQVRIINPVIAEAEGELVWEEGCLSVIEFTAEVTRASRVLVKGWDLSQNEVEIEAEGLEAVCLQHEIDHLDGVLFIDHLSRLKRELYKKRLKKMLRSDEWPSDDGVPRI